MSDERALDPGPLARFEAVKADPNTMSVIVQRVTDADRPETLKDIARSWKVPLGKLSEWITEDRGRTEQYAAALKVAGETAALEILRIADDAKPEDVAVAKLKVEARKWYAGRLARDRFGESQEVRHSGSVSLVAILSSMPKGQVIDVTPEPPALPENVPSKNPAEISDGGLI